MAPAALSVIVSVAATLSAAVAAGHGGTPQLDPLRGEQADKPNILLLFVRGFPLAVPPAPLRVLVVVVSLWCL